MKNNIRLKKEYIIGYLNECNNDIDIIKSILSSEEYEEIGGGKITYSYSSFLNYNIINIHTEKKKQFRVFPNEEFIDKFYTIVVYKKRKKIIKSI